MYEIERESREEGERRGENGGIEGEKTFRIEKERGTGERTEEKSGREG